MDRSSRRGPLSLSRPGRLSNVDDGSIVAARSPVPLPARSPLERHRAHARPHSVLSCPVLSCPSSFETTVKLQLEDLPKMIAVVDELRSRLAALRDTVVDGSRNFWVHLVDVTGESAQASAGAAVVVALRATGGVLCAHACLCCLSGLPRRFDDLSLARALLGRAQIAIQVHYAGSDESAFREWRVLSLRARRRRAVVTRARDPP